MVQRSGAVNTLKKALGLSVVLGLSLTAQALADAGGAEGVGPSDQILLDEPPVTGLINDGDQSMVETVYIYMDGCPIVSITPPADGMGEPQITMIEPSGECVAGRGTQDPADLVTTGEPGMRVQLWKDDPSLLEAIEEDAIEAQGRSLVVEIASLYPRATPAQQTSDGPSADVPPFYVPGVLGDPSGDLLLASGGPNGGGTVIGGGSGTFISGNGGSGGGGGFFGGDDDNGITTIGDLLVNPGGNIPLPDVTAVPLPATLLLLLWALQLLRSYVRRS